MNPSYIILQTRITVTFLQYTLVNVGSAKTVT